MKFPEAWLIRPPRVTTVDPSTGNSRPGAKPDAVPVMGTLEERFPRTDEKLLPAQAVAVESVLLLHPSASRKVPGGISVHHKAIDPDGTVWTIVRIPQTRKPRRPLAPIRYVALVVRRATDIKEK